VSRFLFLLSGACFLASSATALAGDAKLGEKVAQKLCVNCHIVEPGGVANEVNPSIPPFMAIAKKPDQSESLIRGFLIDPHPPMPNIQLTAHELDNIAAYIMSLKE
jgi:cytochrome c